MAQVVQYNYVVHRILSSGKAVFDVVLKQLTEFSTIILMVLLFFFGWLILKCTISGKEIH